MNIRQIRDLALKVLGIYYLAHALLLAPQFFLFFTLDRSQTAGLTLITLSLSVLLPIAFWIIIGLLLTFYTGLVAAVLWPKQEEPETGLAAKPSLRFWIVLIGFYFLVSATGGAVAQVWTLTVRGAFMYYKFLPELVTLVLSIACILKARAIETWLNSKIGEDNQQSAAPAADDESAVKR